MSAFIDVAWDGPSQFVRVDQISAIVEHVDNIGVDVILSSGQVISAPGQITSSVFGMMRDALTTADGA